MASAKTGTVAEVEVQIAASPETVFDFFTDPDKMIQWMGRSAELDPVPGGGLRCDINGLHVAAGSYVELDPPRRIVFTWGWEGEGMSVAPGESTVEVDLVPTAGGTRLRLVHRDLPDADSAGSHNEGWSHYTQRLSIAAAGGDPGLDPWAEPEAHS